MTREVKEKKLYIIIYYNNTVLLLLTGGANVTSTYVENNPVCIFAFFRFIFIRPLERARLRALQELLALRQAQLDRECKAGKGGQRK